jgi:crotonobetainyl-CoA:carnitine CoA-transferase CaiB-like acyl-CoA transferase
MEERLPLDGITVVELGNSVAAPYAGLILGGLGADVIKVENPGGGDYSRDWGPPFWHGTSAMFQVLNRDKRGVAVDLNDADARDGLHRLIVERADVVVQNMRPGVAEKFGLGSEALLTAKPTLVYCSIGAYGATGPLAERPGYDPLMQAFAGIMSVTGEEGGGPVRVGTSIIDMGAGLWAAIGILAAIERRHHTGRGGLVDTSLFETGIAWMAYHVANYLSTGLELERWGSGTPVMVPYQAFATADGHVIVAAGNDAIFGKLCGALERSDLTEQTRFATNAQRVENRDDLISILEPIFALKPSAAWIENLDGAGVPCAPIQSVSEMLAHPQSRALGMVQDAPGLDMALVGLPLSFDGARPPFRRVAPGLGAHDEEAFSDDSDEGEQDAG